MDFTEIILFPFYGKSLYWILFLHMWFCKHWIFSEPDAQTQSLWTCRKNYSSLALFFCRLYRLMANAHQIKKTACTLLFKIRRVWGIAQLFRESTFSMVLIASNPKLYRRDTYTIFIGSILESWIQVYNANRELKDYKPIRGIYMAGRKTSFEERREIVEYCISQNKDYKKGIYLTAYTSSWCSISVPCKNIWLSDISIHGVAFQASHPFEFF